MYVIPKSTEESHADPPPERHPERSEESRLCSRRRDSSPSPVPTTSASPPSRHSGLDPESSGSRHSHSGGNPVYVIPKSTEESHADPPPERHPERSEESRLCSRRRDSSPSPVPTTSASPPSRHSGLDPESRGGGRRGERGHATAISFTASSKKPFFKLHRVIFNNSLKMRYLHPSPQSVYPRPWRRFALQLARIRLNRSHY